MEVIPRNTEDQEVFRILIKYTFLITYILSNTIKKSSLQTSKAGHIPFRAYGQETS